MKSYKVRLEPENIFRCFAAKRHCFFLDSSLTLAGDGRYSFLGAEPFYVFQGSNSGCFSELRKIFSAYKNPAPGHHLAFPGGAVGYFAYDLGFSLQEKLRKKPKAQLCLPDYFLGFYNTVVIIDHLKGLTYICASGLPEKSSSLVRLLSRENFAKARQMLAQAEVLKKEAAAESTAKFFLKSNFTLSQYIRAVKKAKEHIRRGDIYQLNLSQQFQASCDLPAEKLYLRLRRLSPSAFSAYLDCGDFQILSSSPERFLKKKAELVLTSPMKGTRPRGESSLKDRRLRRELLNSAKDKAELLMITDLERNDLGRVCDYSSVKVSCLRRLEEYSTVFQTTASVEGRLRRGNDSFDLLRACFPGGSITGCPKIRAMQIIEELEPHRRGIYTGSLGYISFSGDMEFNILIRTILKKAGRLYFAAGGGIVADSQPRQEYEETLVKARALCQAIGARQ